MVDQEYNRLFAKEDKVLGVKCRGTDYTNGIVLREINIEIILHVNDRNISLFYSVVNSFQIGDKQRNTLI